MAEADARTAAVGGTIAIVGPREIYLGFRALGVAVTDARSAAEAERAIVELARRGALIIFVSEPLVREDPGLLELFHDQATPVVSVIPDHQGSSGATQERIRRLIERAVGVDLWRTTNEGNRS